MSGAGPCRSCGARILWRTVDMSGKTMPVDPTPSEEGNIRLYPDGETCRVLSKEGAAVARIAGEPIYLPHFKSCPQGKAWSERNRGRQEVVHG